jgi:hypothetical protein
MNKLIITLTISLITLSSCCKVEYITPEGLSEKLQVIDIPKGLVYQQRELVIQILENNDVISQLGN